MFSWHFAFCNFNGTHEKAEIRKKAQIQKRCAVMAKVPEAWNKMIVKRSLMGKRRLRIQAEWPSLHEPDGPEDQ